MIIYNSNKNTFMKYVEKASLVILSMMHLEKTW